MNELKVGLLALAAMATIVFMSFKITSNQSGFGDYVSYRTIVDDASGIFPKTPIKVAGINAGMIENIELQGNTALISFKVLKEIIIVEGSKMRIKTVGFLGDKYLEIQLAKGDKRLEEMGFISAESSGNFETIVKDAADLVKDVKVIVASLKDTLVPVGEKSPLQKIMDDLKKLAENARIASESLKNVIHGNEASLNNLIANLEKFSVNIKDATEKDVEGSSVNKLNGVLDNANKIALDLKSIVSDLKAGKGTMGKLLVEEEIADEVRDTLAGVKKIVNRVESIRTELSLFTGVNSESGGGSDANLRIYPSPERFYELGVSTTKLGPTKEKKTVTITNGNSSEEIQKTQDKDTFTFNVQLGRRIHDWAFRGGLIESTGGFGVDYIVDIWGTKFSLEAYDLSREEQGINMRFSSEIQMWNVFYGKASIEDGLYNSRSGTISAGLRFTDEDLKGVLGFFL